MASFVLVRPLLFVLSILTAADGPGDRFIIGESQAGEQVSTISFLFFFFMYFYFVRYLLCIFTSLASAPKSIFLEVA